VSPETEKVEKKLRFKFRIAVKTVSGVYSSGTDFLILHDGACYSFPCPLRQREIFSEDSEYPEGPTH
jgi:hypothetical protein